MIKLTWTRLSLAIVGGSALAATAVVTPALGWVASDSPPLSPPVSPPTSAQLTINKHGKLLEHGAAVKITLTVTCGPGESTSRDLWIDVAQARHRQVALGFGHVSPTCNGEPQRVDVVVRAEDRPFRNGNALVLGRLEASFAGDFHQHGTARETVKLKRQTA